MKDFTITEDFPKNEIEFDKRFSDPAACYEYLFKLKWPNGFLCNKCGLWWFTIRKSGVNAANLKELLGLDSYGTAWNWLQKLRRCTIRKDREKLSGRVEVDEFFIGGQKSGKRGRGAGGKTIVAVAIER